MFSVKRQMAYLAKPMICDWVWYLDEGEGRAWTGDEAMQSFSSPLYGAQIALAGVGLRKRSLGLTLLVRGCLDASHVGSSERPTALLAKFDIQYSVK